MPLKRKMTQGLRYISRIPQRRAVRRELGPQDRTLLEKIRQQKLSYLSDEKFHTLMTYCRAAEENKHDGIFVETGCALGGSAIMIASAKSNQRPLQVYDVFDMIPPPSEADTIDVHERYAKIKAGQSKGIDGDEYYGYMDDLVQVVKNNISSFGFDLEETNISLIKGLIQDTLHMDRPVALAHIDVDWYDPVFVSLERIFPKLVPGGVIILDDYHYWGGCRKAVDAYLGTVAGQFQLDKSGDSVVLIKR